MQILSVENVRNLALKSINYIMIQFDLIKFYINV